MAPATDSPSLSEAARSVWAKSGGRRSEWLPLIQHMVDTGLMAEWLFDNWLAAGLRRHWGRAFGDEATARAVFVFLAAAHDVGKSAPVFSAQLEGLAERSRTVGLPCPRMERLAVDRKELPHATVSALALDEWLRGRGVDEVHSSQLASIVGAHHGRGVQVDPGRPWRVLRSKRAALGGEDWHRVRMEFLDALEERFPMVECLLVADPRPIPLPVQVAMCGLLVMADWLASNQDFFPLRPLDSELAPAVPDDEELRRRFSRAGADLGLPTAWRPVPTQSTVDEFYQDRFGFAPRSLQAPALQLVRDHPVGLMIVEAQMGAGKTEAAYACAEEMASRWGAHGVFIGLPTQATTDAMFGRLMAWVDSLPEDAPDVPAYAMTLAHGKAMLNPTFSTQVEAFRAAWSDESLLSSVAEVHDEEPAAENRAAEPPAPVGLTAAVAHQWFNGRKRRLLTNFGAGTVDQVLMAGLQHKHLMVRHLALAGKVVIIDEVHASDVFMSVYLERVLGWLGHYGTPVILLSATLTQERKDGLIRAYAPNVPDVPPAPGYPCITWVDSERTQSQAVAVVETTRPRFVSVKWLSDDDAAICSVLQQELEDGGCALVVRNTVGDAQRLADHLRSEGIADEVLLCHSRFLAADRARKDQELLAKFGRGSGLGSRPERAVVVATQVVEQSLDVDFDVLVTDLAPMDLIFQRIGRLHRHEWRRRPAHLTEARVHVLVQDDDAPIRRGSRGSHFIYGDHAMLRTSVVMDDHGPQLELPGDIAPLVQRALGEQKLDVEESARLLLSDAEGEFRAEQKLRREKAKTWALRAFDPAGDAESSLSGNGWMRMGSDFSEAAQQSTVRDAHPSLEVIVAICDPEGVTAMSPPWMDDPCTIDTSVVPDDDSARRIASWTVKLPELYQLRRGSSDDASWIVLAEEAVLAQTRRWSWRKHPLLKGQPVLVMRQVEEGSHTVEGTIRVGGAGEVRLRYDPVRGLEEVRDVVQPD